MLGGTKKLGALPPNAPRGYGSVWTYYPGNTADSPST